MTKLHATLLGERDKTNQTRQRHRDGARLRNGQRRNIEVDSCRGLIDDNSKRLDGLRTRRGGGR